MKDIVRTRYGPPKVLQLREDERPTPKEVNYQFSIDHSQLIRGQIERRKKGWVETLN